MLRFAIFTAAVVVLAGFGLLVFLRHEVTLRTEHGLGDHTRFIAETTVRNAVRPSDFAGPVTRRRRIELDRVFRRDVLVAGAVRVKLWSPDAKVTYSNDPSLIGSESDDDFDAVMDGRQMYEVSKLNDEGGNGPDMKTLSVYSPVRLNATARPVGIFELYQDYAPVAAAVRSTLTPVAIALALTLLALYISLFPILRRVTRTVELRNKRLSEQAEDLDRALEEQRQAEDALRTSKQTLESIVDGAPLAIVAVDLENRVQAWNRAAERIFGWTAEEIIGKPSPLVPQEDRGNHRTRITEALRGATVMDRETKRLRKDGSLVDVSVSKAPIRNHEGRTTSVISVLADVTDRTRAEQQARQAEEALRKAEEQLRQSQKLEALGQLAGGVAHDFNNMMCAVIGFSELILARLEETHPLRGEIEEIRRAGERAATMTNQLLAFSRKQILQPKVLDLNKVVTDTEKLLERLIAEDIELVSILDPHLDAIEVDPSQLEQVIVNLAVNARDAMPRGGKLTIETGNVLVDADYAGAHSEVEPGNYVLLTVHDTGTGMDAETQAHIFEPFFTTKAPGMGTGLGLATVFGIVKQHGGAIEVFSEPDRGTTFTVHLPRARRIASGDEIPKAAPALQAVPRGGATILLVEDEEVVRHLERQVLEECGYTVLETSGPAEALELSARHEGPIDLLFTDVVMPGMSGRALADKLASTRPEMKVLYASGYTGEAIVRHGVLEQGIAFLPKPLTPASLAQKVHELLGETVRPEPARSVG